MSALHPIEPLVHDPRGAASGLDFREEWQRRLALETAEELGLRPLLGGDSVPRHALAGVSEGIWTAAGCRGTFLVREEFVSDHTVEKVRWCFVAGLDPATSAVRPLVEAQREEVDLAVSHLRRAGTDPVGVVALYRDADQRVSRMAEARAEIAPLLEMRTPNGGSEQVWRLTDGEAAAVSDMIAAFGAAIVGDVALYRALLLLRDDPIIARDNRPAVRFYNQRDFGIAFSSSARLYEGCGDLDVNQLLDRLHALHEVEEFDIAGREREAPARLADRLRSLGVGRRAVGLLVRGIPTAFLISAEPGSVTLVGHENPPEVARQYDAEWIEKGILRRLAGDRAPAPRLVLADPASAWEQLAVTGARLAFLLNAPAKRHLPDLLATGWRLPLGTLQMHPPVPRGLFLQPLQPSDEVTAAGEATPPR